MRMKKEVEKMGKNREDIVCKDDRFKLTTYHRQPQHKAMLFNHIHGMISFLFCSFISSFMLWHTIIYRIPFVILSSSSLFAFIPRFLSGSYQSVVAWEPFPFFYITFILRDVTCDSWKISNQLILSSDSFIPWLLLSLFGWLLMMMMLLLSLFFAAPISHYILFSSVISWVEHLFLFAILSICHGLAACFTHASV